MINRSDLQAKDWGEEARTQLAELQALGKEVDPRIYAMAGLYQVKVSPDVSPEPIRGLSQVAFMHVFKTGGTTVADWLDRHLTKGYAFVPFNAIHLRDFSEFLNFKEIQLVRGHFRLCDAMQTIPPKWMLISMIRKPEAQLMSAIWHYILNENGSLNWESREHPPMIEIVVELYFYATRIKFLEEYTSQCAFFLREPSLLPTSDSEISSWLNSPDKRRAVLNEALSGLDEFECIGLTERMRDSLRLFAWKLRLPAPREYGYTRLSSAGSMAVPRVVMEKCSNILEIDSMFYDAVSNRFDSQFNELVEVSGGIDNIDNYLDMVACI